MVSTNDVYRKIKEISSRVPNPRPQILVQSLAHELMLVGEQILPCLVELKDLRLIKVENASYDYIKLTLLGNTVTRQGA